MSKRDSNGYQDVLALLVLETDVSLFESRLSFWESDHYTIGAIILLYFFPAMVQHGYRIWCRILWLRQSLEYGLAREWDFPMMWDF